MRFLANATSSSIENGTMDEQHQHNDTDNRSNNGDSNGKCARSPTIAMTDVGKAFNNVVAPDKNGQPIAIDGVGTVQVQPVLVRKTPKFPSRERHMAIRRKKLPTSAPLPWSQPRGTSTCCCNHTSAHVDHTNSIKQKQFRAVVREQGDEAAEEDEVEEINVEVESEPDSPQSQQT